MPVHDRGGIFVDLKTCYEQLDGDYEDVMGRLRQEERVIKFLQLFPEDENFDLLTRALAEQDWPVAFRAVHSIKGVALTLGLTALAASSSELTELLRPGQPAQDLGPFYRTVKEDYEKTVAAIGALS